ncbi:S49 family peptidase [Immundisolibacter cernigliae]|uniref:Peptidase S49 n=1 Tax=Immundisolibacter cernigliae TaxID=1810504 RepID=A0A1B1YS04_9GAMM|nr:S49 family peptidase [Immundisolibacter cernigliae]ANX03552.1 peptidase S49 [Immundisolibacter cernigliae]
MNDDTNPTAWERGVLERLLRDTLTEQRRARRWRIFFRLLSVLLVLLVLGLFRADVGVPQVASRHTALVQLNGIIAPGTDANADIIIESLRKAYENTQVAGVVLRIDSPGGSPVQAGRINAEIRRLRELHPKVPLYAVIDDICASGGYYVAVAADRIYADKASVVGSIGVLMNGFGFVDAMQKLGIERRLLTAGDHKGFLDPFSPQSPEDADHARELLQAIHSQFIEVVKDGRGARLKDDPRLFSGLVWTGDQGIELGLVDALGDTDSVAREVFKADKVVDYTVRPAYFEKLIRSAGGEAASSLLDALSDGLRWR